MHCIFHIITFDVSRKRKELPLLENVEIKDVAAEGNAIARVDDMVVFVPFAAPGDIADIKIDRKKRNYAEGHVARMVAPSPLECAAAAAGSTCLTGSSSSASSSRWPTR